MGAFLLLSLLISSPLVHAEVEDNFPRLTGGDVTPDSDVWGSTFTFAVTYTDNDNGLPAAGWPKLSIDNETPGRTMSEVNPADNDTTDGKVYRHYWTTTKDNVGVDNFYFYVENARDPTTGVYSGLTVAKKSTSLACEVDNPEPASGENVTFSGRLTSSDNQGAPDENLVLYKVLYGDDVRVDSVATDENGYFSLSIEAPSPGVFFYRVEFSGDDYYEESSPSSLHVNTLNESLVFGVPAVVLLVATLLIFLLSRKMVRAHYLKPVLLGFIVGFFLSFFMLAAFLVLALAGGIAGYLSAKRIRGWTRHLRVGCMTGLLFVLMAGFSFIITVESPETFFMYSVSQSYLLASLLVQVLFYASLTGLAAVIGGMLRGEPKSQEAEETSPAKP
jgi:hypothetical protein